MDLELARESITHTLHASQILNIDSDMHQTWQSILDRLPGLKLGSKGQLLEWDRELEEQEPGHRHISHLVGFFPGEQIHPDRTPDLFAGAIRSLEIRLANAGGHTGWSRAWTACCFARAGDGDRAFEHLEHLITDFATDTRKRQSTFVGFGNEELISSGSRLNGSNASHPASLSILGARSSM